MKFLNILPGIGFYKVVLIYSIVIYVLCLTSGSVMPPVEVTNFINEPFSNRINDENLDDSALVTDVWMKSSFKIINITDTVHSDVDENKGASQFQQPVIELSDNRYQLSTLHTDEGYNLSYSQSIVDLNDGSYELSTLHTDEGYNLSYSQSIVDLNDGSYELSTLHTDESYNSSYSQSIVDLNDGSYELSTLHTDGGNDLSLLVKDDWSACCENTSANNRKEISIHSSTSHQDSLATASLLTAQAPGLVSNTSTRVDVLSTSSLGDVADYKELFFDINDCAEDFILHISASTGDIYGFTNAHNATTTAIFCNLLMTVPDGQFVYAEFEFLRNPCTLMKFELTAYTTVKSTNSISNYVGSISCNVPSMLLVSDTNAIYFMIRDKDPDPIGELIFRIRFRSSKESLRNTLHVVFTSNVTGYVTSEGFDNKKNYAPFTNATYTLIVPEHHSVMISFSLLDLRSPSYQCDDYVEVLLLDDNRNLTSAGKRCANIVVPAEVYTSSSVIIRFFAVSLYTSAGFKMLFSFHPISQTPRKLDNGLFDCSLSFYGTFRQHLDCNLEVECLDGIDESGECPFSSMKCNGSVAINNKCYSYTTHSFNSYEDGLTQFDIALNWNQADDKCRKRGMTLATMKTNEEWDAFLNLFQYGKRARRPCVGLRLRSGFSMPGLYRKSWSWADTTVAYHINISRLLTSTGSDLCTYFEVSGIRSFLSWSTCDTNQCQEYVCQSAQGSEPGLMSEDIRVLKLANRESILNRSELHLVPCLNGHATHDFLACDPKTDCGVNRYLYWCNTSHTIATNNAQSNSDVIVFVTAAMFRCRDDKGTLAYTLVCDFKRDCADGSDEEFCKHSDVCSGFTCSNAQCVTIDQRCDGQRDCFDSSDESECLYSLSLSEDKAYRYPPPAIIHFDKSGTYTQVTLAVSQACPETHFRCPDGYCLPVYTRCNGVYDCVGREDEADCSAYTCPGFYRCRASSICVHADHLCDGWPLCPERDDEAFCGFRCPEGCLCQGLAYVCGQPFIAREFPDVRYLDASGSGMTPSDLARNMYLVYLSLASCQLSELPVLLYFPNLQVLDLSANELTIVSMNIFLALNNLKELRLKGNPLVILSSEVSNLKQDILKTVDLSMTNIKIFDSKVFIGFPQIQYLNISYTPLNIISNNGLSYLPRLTELDIRGSPVYDFPSDIFRGLLELQTIFAENYKICCQAILPSYFDEYLCFAPMDELSSCEDLLRSNTYRASLWIMSAMSLLGNAGSIIFRTLFQKSSSASGYNVFVTNLSFADFLMGVYLLVIGVADLMYRGNYLWYEKQWKSSVVCKTAGFLSLLSNEMSAFVICLITLDRFIALRFPFATFRFTKRSALVACIIAWTAGLLLAGAPLLPWTSHWEFYSQTGICIPLPITRKQFPGQHYSFGILIVWNFILFLAIAAGQISVYWSIRKNSMVTDTTRKSQDLTIARRLMTVVMVDFLCWFPTGLLGLMASTGTPIPDEVNVGIAIFILPLNAALNPFLYTYNMLVEKRRRLEEQRLLKRLESQIVTSKTEESSRVVAARTQETAEEIKKCIQTWLKANIVTADDIRALLNKAWGK